MTGQNLLIWFGLNVRNRCPDVNSTSTPYGRVITVATAATTELVAI